VGENRPFFSVVIPTLERADTFEHALATVVAQAHSSLEIVVQNNGGDPGTRRVVEAAGDSRIRLFETSDVLPMTQNWERALGNARGEWVTFLGDDDGLLPDACEVAGAVLEDVGEDELLSWEPFLYLWPDYWNPRRRNVLQATVERSFVVQRVPSRPMVHRLYGFALHYSKLPMIYNSFVRRSLIERVVGDHGRYFVGALPDVTSGIVNAAYSEWFLKSTRPLSVAGVSRHSTGHRLHRSGSPAAHEDLLDEFPELASVEIPITESLELCIAADMALVRESIRGQVGELALDRRAMLQRAAQAINEAPDRYDAAASAIRRLADRYGFGPDGVPIPPALPEPPRPPEGTTELGPDVALVVLDGAPLGLRTIADAARAAADLVPDVGALVRADPRLAADGVPVVEDGGLRFDRHSGGAFALVSGWSDPEAWGTWSVGEESILRVRVPALRTTSPVKLALRYRVIPVPDGSPSVVECAVGDAPLARWELDAASAAGELTLDVPGGPELVEIRLVAPEAKSPLELGLSDDPRRLGIGVEELRVLA